MNHLVTALKGMCMGFADVVPGVSGGTMALLLGIYVKFIEAVKSVNLSWVAPLGAWIVSGFKREKRDAVLEPLLAIHWSFLIPLVSGIVVAFGIGARVIPTMMDAYPAEMRGFFFGLIVASLIVPFREMKKRGLTEAAVAVVLAIGTFAGVGAHSEPALSWAPQTLEESVSLEDFSRAHPSVRTPEHLWCSHGEDHDNVALRDAVAADPEQVGVATRLDEICAGLAEREDDLEAWIAYRDSITNEAGDRIMGRKHDENPFNTVVVPAGTPVQTPTPALWFIFVGGLLGICAMVLPGISGSFILLVMGLYHFMLSSALKGLIYGLIDLTLPTKPALYVAIFGTGCIIGIASFARVMSWLFKRHQALTLAAMIGIMIGALRAIWPWKLGDPHVGVINAMPTSGEVAGPLTAFAVGLVLVVGLTVLGSSMGSDDEVDDVADA